MIHAANANSSDSLGLKRKRSTAAAFLSGSSDGEDLDDSKECLKKAAKKEQEK
jgi:hypothetical protein